MRRTEASKRIAMGRAVNAFLDELRTLPPRDADRLRAHMAEIIRLELRAQWDGMPVITEPSAILYFPCHPTIPCSFSRSVQQDFYPSPQLASAPAARRSARRNPQVLWSSSRAARASP